MTSVVANYETKAQQKTKSTRVRRKQRLIEAIPLGSKEKNYSTFFFELYKTKTPNKSGF